MKSMTICTALWFIGITAASAEKELKGSVPTNRTTDTEILTGALARPGQFPYVASLTERVATSGYGNNFCGVSILTECWLVTGARCVDPYQDAKGNFIHVALVGVVHATVEAGVEHYLERVHLHPEYDPDNSWVNDIALIRLERPIEFNQFAQPIALSTSSHSIPEGHPATAMSWGRLNHSAYDPWLLHYADVYIHSYDFCRKIYAGRNLTIYDRTRLCAGPLDEFNGYCTTHVGSPLIHDDVLIGIVSWGYGWDATSDCSYTNYTHVYTRISDYLPWIHDTVGYVF